MIGLSTGAWAQVIANIPDVEKLTIVEINRGYLRIIPQYADVASLLRNPKVEIIIDDGRRWLARHPERTFDVIVSNTTFHWRANATNLLSQEFFLSVRQHLKPGGIFHVNTTGSADAYKTAFTIFPYGLRFINFATVSDSPIAINGERWKRALDAHRGGWACDIRFHSCDRSRQTCAGPVVVADTERAAGVVRTRVARQCITAPQQRGDDHGRQHASRVARS